MPSTSTLAEPVGHASPRRAVTPSLGARRFGHAVAIVVNAVLLWVVHHLLDWGWPGFLTARFDDVLPLLTVSFVATIAAQACFLVRDRGRVRALADLVTSAIGVAVSVRVWQVFPFDFTGYDHDWSWAFRTLLVVGVVGSAIGALVNLVKLVSPGGHADR